MSLSASVLFFPNFPFILSRLILRARRSLGSTVLATREPCREVAVVGFRAQDAHTHPFDAVDMGRGNRCRHIPNLPPVPFPLSFSSLSRDPLPAPSVRAISPLFTSPLFVRSFSNLLPPSLPNPSSFPPFFSPFFCTHGFTSVCAFHLCRSASWCHPTDPLFSHCLVSPCCDGRGGGGVGGIGLGRCVMELPIVRVSNGLLVFSCQMWSLGSGVMQRLEPATMYRLLPRTRWHQRRSTAVPRYLLTVLRFPHSPPLSPFLFFFCHSDDVRTFPVDPGN